jgi:hypothetical protein
MTLTTYKPEVAGGKWDTKTRKTRDPKAEIRKKSETRGPKSEEEGGFGFQIAFGVWISAGFGFSGFGFALYNPGGLCHAAQIC